MSTLPYIIDSEAFGEGSRIYFIDIRKTRTNQPFLQITRRDEEGQTFKRSQVIIFEKDLFFFLEALTMLMGRYSSGETKIN